MALLRVAVADGHRLFAEGLARALRDHGDLDVSEGCSTTGREILRCVAARKPEVALIDFCISDMAGPVAARSILSVSPSTRVMFLTESSIGPIQREQGQTAGGLEFLHKDLALEDVVHSIRTAAATPVPRDLARGDGRAAERVRRLMTLSARELEVLQVLRTAASSREAATKLSISSGTLKNHVHNILVKTEARSQLEALIMAEEEGWISGA